MLVFEYRKAPFSIEAEKALDVGIKKIVAENTVINYVYALQTNYVYTWCCLRIFMPSHSGWKQYKFKWFIKGVFHTWSKRMGWQIKITKFQLEYGELLKKYKEHMHTSTFCNIQLFIILVTWTLKGNNSQLELAQDSFFSSDIWPRERKLSLCKRGIRVNWVRVIKVLLCIYQGVNYYDNNLIWTFL